VANVLIVDDSLKAYILESVHVPTKSSHFFILDLQMLDFTLTPLEVLEEVNCPALVLNIENYEFALPSHWNVLIIDEDTSQLDIVTVDELAGKEFTLFAYDNERSYGYGIPVRVVNYLVDCHHVNPSLNRHHMLCHPFDSNKWICIAPNDGYNKYLKNLVLGDIV
jgi:hypothetical protein